MRLVEVRSDEFGAGVRRVLMSEETGETRFGQDVTIRPMDSARLKPIAPLDLSSFERPSIPGNRGLLWRAAWYVTNALLFQSALIGLAPSRIKAAVLRAFGAKVGTGWSASRA